MIPKAGGRRVRRQSHVAASAAKRENRRNALSVDAKENAMSRTWTVRGAGLLALVGIFGGCGHTVAPAFFESVDSGAVSGDDGGSGGFGVLPEGGSFIPSFSDAG